MCKFRLPGGMQPTLHFTFYCDGDQQHCDLPPYVPQHYDERPHEVQQCELHVEGVHCIQRGLVPQQDEKQPYHDYDLCRRDMNVVQSILQRQQHNEHHHGN